MAAHVKLNGVHVCSSCVRMHAHTQIHRKEENSKKDPVA